MARSTGKRLVRWNAPGAVRSGEPPWLVSAERFCYVRFHVKEIGMTKVRLRLSRWMQARQVRDLAGAA